MTNTLSQNDTARARRSALALRASGNTRWQTGLADLALSPSVWIIAFVATACLALVLPLRLPIGSFYWDVTLYPDAAWRIANGQLPNVAFFTPAGPLEYFGFALLQTLFPNGQILLIANWSVLIVALPLLAGAVAQVSQNSRGLALALVLPFLFFAALPLNTTEVYPMPGIDGYGMYNRHAALLIYVLLTVLLYTDQARAQITLLAGVMLALFFTKITGFLVGVGLITHALVAGLIHRRTVWFASILAAAVALAIDFHSGIVTAYLSDLATLARMNEDGLLSELRKPFLNRLDVIAPITALALFLLWKAKDDILSMVTPRTGAGLWERIQTAANLDGVWLLSLLVACIVYESQNAGSLEFILLWPLLLSILYRRWPLADRNRIAVAILAAIALLPLTTGYANRAIRLAVVGLKYQPLAAPGIGLLGMVKAKPDLIDRARAMNVHYAENKAAYDKLAARGHQQSYLLYSEIDFQLGWMLSTEEAVQAIHAFEKRNNLHLDQIMTLDFIDPLPALLGRRPVLHMSIGRSEGRTIPSLDEKRMRAALGADAILAPRCPVTATRRYLVQMFEPVLKQRVKQRLSPCWDIYLKPSLARAR
ncbi:MAG: hypothetical protein KDJ29_01190 [Hyphomicrobiales bacterium]|nr:hypothetical protein [Hyphomicrobiales bacterium]